MRILLVALAVLALAAPAALAAAAHTTLGDVEDEVMCPVCGTPLNLASEAPQAQDERAYIQRLIDRCESKDQIKRALVAEYGKNILALPGDQGSDDLGDVLVYVIPALGILLAAAGIAFAVIRWRRPTPRGPGSAVPAAEGARLEDDMERYDL
jgi:cytochrome c-type biogenesis protein CcmH